MAVLNRLDQQNATHPTVRAVAFRKAADGRP